MKTKNRSFFNYLRFGAGLAFLAAAGALAFIGTLSNVPTAHGDVATSAPDINLVDVQANPQLNLATEEAKKRAYPADETPFTAQLNALAGVRRMLVTSASNATPTPGTKGGKLTAKSKKAPPQPPRFNNWFPTGPFLALDPSVLTFSGAGTSVSGRITALALDTHNGCSSSYCRLWVGAAGGGVWRTTNALSGSPTWTFLTSLDVFSNAIGAITFFDNGTTNGVLYVGTGEPNASADSEAGLGLMRSTDGGDTWTQLSSLIGPITTNAPGTGTNGTYSGNAFFGRSISKVVVDPTNSSVIYVASARGVRGIDETYGGPTSNPPVPRPPFGLFKSTNGGLNFTYIFDGDPSCGTGNTCLGSGAISSIRGMHDLALDPSNNNIVYTADFPGPSGGGGVWRSTNGGSSWTQIKTALVAADNVDRCSFSVNSLGGGVTRMYVGCGNDGAATAQVYRSDAVQTGAPAFTNLTAIETYPATTGYCGTQCWYDNVIYSPPGFPDVIYVGGSYTYNECAHGSDCRGVVYATNAGDLTLGFSVWSDATWDAQNSGFNPNSCCNPNTVTPNQMHPDHHFLLTVPGNPFLFFDGSDGGLVRTDGNIVDISAQCGSRTYPGGTGSVTQCENLLGTGCPFAGYTCGVPNQIISLNNGLNTLQFNSFSVAGNNPVLLQGGTQDNGTFSTNGSYTWNQVIYGDGGQGGINQANSNLRVNTFTGQANDANFQNGNPLAWVIVGANMENSPEGSFFYPPVLADPALAAANTIFQGSYGVWRTQDWGGSQAFLEANCPEFFTSAAQPGCGDFVRLGGPAGSSTAGSFIGTFYGGDRTGGAVNVIARTTSNTNVAWGASSAGRVFISTNVDTNPATSVIWNRLDADTGASKDPTRVPTGIAIDPFNNFHAWVSYSGYNFNTPSQPGHVFSVTWTGAGTATWTDISNNLPDLPYTSIVEDPVTGDLYVSCDFIVFRLASGQAVWDVAGLGLPFVEVPHLTIVPGARVIYAATHGLGGWLMSLY